MSATDHFPKRLFLTGPSGCGKSTMLRKALQGKLAPAGGFTTDRVVDEAGRYRYFYLQRADGSGVPEIFLDLRQKPPVKHDAVFTGPAVELLREQAPFFLLDEIGGMELLLPEFRAALDDFLASGIPCIGVLKGTKNGQALSRTAGLPETYFRAAEDLHHQLETDKDTQILELSGWDDPAALAAVTAWAEEYAHGSILSTL